MMRAVVAEAAHASQRVPFGRAVTGRHALAWGAVGVLAVAFVAGGAALLPEAAGLWARRSLLLEDVSWPRRTTMVAVDRGEAGERPHPVGDPYEVSLGRSFTVYARAVGVVPDEAWLEDFAPGQQPLARRMYAVTGDEGLFALEFRDVRRPFAFTLRGGDDDDGHPEHRVEIVVPPSVVAISATVAWPEYLGARTEEVAGGNLAIPEGGRATVRFEASEPLADARVAIGEVVLPATPVPGTDDRAFTFSFDARESAHYRLVLRTPQGRSNDASADTFEVRVLPDEVPLVDWVYPRSGQDLTRRARVPLLISARDDHGVASLSIDLLIGGGVERRFALSPHDPDALPDESGMPLAALDGRLGRRQVAAYLPLDLALLRDPAGSSLAEGETVSVRAVALDARGQERVSDWLRLDLHAAARVERDLAGRRTDVRSAFEALAREQAARRDEVAQILQGEIGRPELDLLKTVRFAQGRVAQDADRAARDLIEVFNGFVLNRLTAEAPTAKVLGLFDAHHRATYGRASETPAADALAWRGDPVFPYPLQDEIVAAWRDKTIYDTMVLDRMLGVLADAVDLAARLAPAAQAASVRAVSDERARVEALLAAQEASLAALTRLLAGMEGWQTLHELTLFLRGIIDQHEALFPKTGPAGSGGSDAK
jgi:hypothetical protein